MGDLLLVAYTIFNALYRKCEVGTADTLPDGQRGIFRSRFV